MVTIEKHGKNFVFEIRGFHKLWALKSQLTIPVENIVEAYPNQQRLDFLPGLKMPGTHIPGTYNCRHLYFEGRYHFL